MVQHIYGDLLLVHLLCTAERNPLFHHFVGRQTVSPTHLQHCITYIQVHANCYVFNRERQCSNLSLLSPDLASAWPIVVVRQYLYEVKFNKRRSQSQLQIDRSLLMYYCYNILSRIVGLFWLSWSCLWSNAVNYETPMRSNVPDAVRCGN